MRCVLKKMVSKLVTICSGTKEKGFITKCYSIERRGIWYHVGERIYNNVKDEVDKRNEWVSHGTCYKCFDKYMSMKK